MNRFATGAEIDWKGFVLRILVFPWGLWDLASLLPRRLRRRHDDRPALRSLSYVLQGVLYLGLGFPLTILGIGELLVSTNEQLMAEQADYRLQSDFSEGMAELPLELPGPDPYTPPPVPPEPTDAFRRYLVELYAPTFVHKMSNRPEWDIPRFLDFDGTLDPRDNVMNEPAFRHREAGVYGELTAETEDSYYLTYSLYHVKDYDHPIRERLVRWTYHDNDNEGLHIRVDKETMGVTAVETWFHNRFLLFNRTGISTGSEPVHGAIHTENGTHVLVYAQPQGHGIRLLQAVDLPSIEERVKIMRYRGDGEVVPMRADGLTQVNVTYDLRNFDAWYAVATGPFVQRDASDAAGIFEDTIPLGFYPDGSPLFIGRYIAGRDYYIGGWSRPKPMWSWDDGWDEIPNFIWHFFPSYSFESHGGERLSHRYLFNRPAERTFGVPADTLLGWLDLEVERREGGKWDDNLEERGGKLDHRYYWAAGLKWVSSTAKRYVNYLFHALG